MLLPATAAFAAEPGSLTADLTWYGTWDILRMKIYGAGWPYGDLTITYRIYRNDVLWRQDTLRRKSTSFNYSWDFTCGPGIYFLNCDVYGPWSTHAFDSDGVWAR